MFGENGGIRLRKAGLEDIEGIMKIELDAFHQEIVESKEVYLDRLGTFSEGFFVLEEAKDEKAGLEKGLIGYVCGELWDYEECPEPSRFLLGHDIKKAHNIEGEELYIASMGLLREKRKFGYGRELFQQFISKMEISYPKLRSVILIVCESWIGARKIYEGAGFAEIMEIPGFFDFGDIDGRKKGIVMRKSLK